MKPSFMIGLGSGCSRQGISRSAKARLLAASQRFRQMMGQLRQMLDRAGAANKLLVLAADGSFCNRTVFSSPRDRTEIVARARKDAVLCFRAPQPSRRFYALDKFTPEQVRQD